MIEAAVYTPKNMKKKEEKIIFVSNIYTQFNLNFCCIFKLEINTMRTKLENIISSIWIER
jgi:hypothetical protein